MAKERGLYSRGGALLKDMPTRPSLYNLNEMRHEASVLAERRNALGGFGISAESNKQRGTLKAAMNRGEKITSELEKIQNESRNPDITIRASAIRSVHEAGAAIAYREALDAFAKQVSSTAAQEYMDKEAFIKAGSIDVKLYGISLRMLANKKNLPIAALVDFFMTPYYLDKGETPPGFIEENRTTLTEEFPNLHLLHLHEASTIIAATVNTCRLDSEEYKAAQRSFPLAAPVTKSLLANAFDFHLRLHSAVSDPHAQGFADVKERVQTYLDGSPDEKSCMIHLLAFAENEKLQNLFRKSLQHINSADNGAFYQQFTDTLRTYVYQISEFTNLRTKDELEEVFTPYGANQDPVPELTEYRQAVTRIIPNKSKDKDSYELNLEDIAWGEITKPQSATLAFTPGKPMQFGVTLHYENEDEETNISLGVDARKGEFEWNYLEDPNSEEMQGFSNATKRVVMQALAQVERVTKAEKQERDAAKFKPQATPVYSRIRGARPAPEAVPESRKRRRAEPEEVDLGSVIADASQQESGVRNTIIMPEEAVLEKKMKGFSETDQQLVREGITAYTDEGVGGFKMLKRKAADGSRRFALRINIGSKGVRVLLKEAESSDGQRSFTIVKIGRRRDVYKGDVS